MKVEYMDMPWKNEHNVVDYGIHSMRHMETYRGMSIQDWNSGFTGGLEDVSTEIFKFVPYLTSHF